VMNVKGWKIVAENWRTIDGSVEKLSIVQIATKKALQEIKDKGLLVTQRDFLRASASADELADLP
jgi:hypothetical protein